MIGESSNVYKTLKLSPLTLKYFKKIINRLILFCGVFPRKVNEGEIRMCFYTKFVEYYCIILNSPGMKRCAGRAILKVTFQTVLVDWGTVYDSIPLGRTATSPAVIRYA